MKKNPKPLTTKTGDVRELTREDFRSKSVVSVSLDKEVIAALRKSGDGWQTRLNDLAKAALGLAHPEK